MYTPVPTFAIVAAVVAVTLTCLISCTPNPEEEAAGEAAVVNASENTVQPFPVEAVVVTSRTLNRSIVASGRLMAFRRTELSSGVPGKALEVLARVGDRVEEGDLLLRLDTAPFELDVKKAEADLEAEHADISFDLEEFEWYPVLSIGVSYRY